jgi:hypothetical protein
MQRPRFNARTGHWNAFVDCRFAWMFMLSYSSSILACSTHTWNWRNRNAATLCGSQNVLLRNIEPRLTITFPSSEHILSWRDIPYFQSIMGICAFSVGKYKKCNCFNHSCHLCQQKRLGKFGKGLWSCHDVLMLFEYESTCCPVVIRHPSITESWWMVKTYNFYELSLQVLWEF